MKKTKKKYRCHTHSFQFQIAGQKNPFTVSTRVVNAKKPVTLRLTAADVERSMAANGVGNTQTCSMAVCAKRQAEAFPHPVEGFIDWTYTRAFVVSKVSKKTGMPEECVVYVHSDKIAQLNDTKDGQKQLLSELLEYGDRDISLRPVSAGSSGRSGKRTGQGRKRAPRAIPLKGANLRFAVAQLGGVPSK